MSRIEISLAAIQTSFYNGYEQYAIKAFGRLNASIDMNGLQEIIRQFQAPVKPCPSGRAIGSRFFALKIFLPGGIGQICVHLHLQSLAALSVKLPGQFYRIQKSYIINKDRVKEMHRHFNGRYLFIMEDQPGSRLVSGRTDHESIKNEFGI